MCELVNCDAMQYLQMMDDSSADLIILDPDYNDWNDMIEKGLIKEAHRVCKKTGNILCFTKLPKGNCVDI